MVYGVKGISSYTDLPVGKETNKQAIKRRMVANDADSVLLTRLISQRTESVTSPHQYGDWGDYYRSSRGSELVAFDSPTTTRYVILTIESVLFDLKTEKMIWSAQLETVVEGTLEDMMLDYVVAVTKDLKEKGLISQGIAMQKASAMLNVFDRQHQK